MPYRQPTVSPAARARKSRTSPDCAHRSARSRWKPINRGLPNAPGAQRVRHGALLPRPREHAVVLDVDAFPLGLAGGADEHGAQRYARAAAAHGAADERGADRLAAALGDREAVRHDVAEVVEPRR